MTTEILDAPKSLVAEYQPFYAQLVELEKDNSVLVFDYEDKKGNKEARSHVNKLRLTKGALERTRKTAKEESLRVGRAIDAEAKEIEARIEAMIRVHQDKLDEIEQREKDRVSKLANRLAELTVPSPFIGASAEIREAISRVESVAIDESWEEFAQEAAMKKDSALSSLRKDLAAREQYEAEQAELARLRAEAAERERKEREEAIAKAAAEKAQAAAELKAKQEREAAERRELELKLQAEQAERRRIEAEQKAIRDAEEAAVRAEAEKRRAIQAEKDRIAAEQRAEAEAQAKREANKAHRAKINNAALAALVAGGINEECAKECIKLIASGKVPAVQINY